MSFRVTYTYKEKDKDTVILVKHKPTIASATNLVHKVHSSLSHNLVALEIKADEGWVDYDMPWTGQHREVKERLAQLMEFHEVFYDDSHQG